MSIRLRRVEGAGLVALCAARSMPKDGDIYLDDDVHQALSRKFWCDMYSMHGSALSAPPADEVTTAVDAEESNNPNRAWWDKEYGAADLQPNAR